MQMIMFFVGNQAPVLRQRKAVRSQVVQRAQRPIRADAVQSTIEDAVLLIDRPVVPRRPRITIPDYVPTPRHRDAMEEEVERWDGLY